MKRAILVLGPESTGTRLITRALLLAGCKGSADHRQPFDLELPANERLIAWRRSVPHNKVWPDINQMFDSLDGLGYNVYAVVTTRDFFAVTESQVKNRHVPNKVRAIGNICKAYSHIFSELNRIGIRHIVISYESLIQRPTLCLRENFKLLGLHYPGGIEVRDGNSKFYKE